MTFVVGLGSTVVSFGIFISCLFYFLVVRAGRAVEVCAGPAWLMAPAE
jgi:hypothetical protein